VKCLIRGPNSFQVLAGVTSEPELKLVAGHGLLDRIVMSIKLVANGRSDKIGTIRVEPFLYEEIDMTKVNITEVDRYLLAIACLRAKFVDIVGRLYHLHTIHTDGNL
jgi:hypothetical protein